MMLRSELLGSSPSLRHAFFTRRGGVSEGVWASLNVGLRSGDAPERVAQNRARAAAALGLDAMRLVTARQVHGAAVRTVMAPWDNTAAPEADGLVTDGQAFGDGKLAPQDMHVGAADRRRRDPDQRVRRADIRDRFLVEHDTAGLDKDGGFHLSGHQAANPVGWKRMRRELSSAMAPLSSS